MRPDEIIVVTGLPRSGSTMMLRMIEAGGIPAYYDQTRPMAWTEGNREFINYNRILRETDKTKGLRAGNGNWFSECRGMVVKVLTPSKVTIPPGHKCKFIYMDRATKHMANSLKKLSERTGKERAFPVSAPKDLLMEHLRMATRDSIKALKAYPHSKLLIISFEEAIKRPKSVALKVARFLGEQMDIDKMARVVVKRPAMCLPEMLEETIYMNQ